MNRHSEPEDNRAAFRDKIIGLGEQSIHKSYYLQLRQQVEELEKNRRFLEEKSAALTAMLDNLETVRKELADSQAQYRALVENINDVIFSLDLEGKITYISPVIRNLCGLTPDQCTGQPMNTFIQPEDQPLLAAGIQQTLDGRSISKELRLLCHGENCCYVHMSCRPLVKAGQIVGLTGVMSDITDRKQAEKQIRRLNEELEQRVADRTRQLEISNKELEAFGYSVSHDLRAPLRTIDGFSQILLDDYTGRLDAEAVDYLQRIRTAIRRMSELINSLLKLSRIARSEIVRKDINLTTLAHAVLQELQKTDPDRRVEVVITPDLHAHADQNLMRIVLENLLGNAWKFTRKTSNPRIEIGRTRWENTEAFFVRDNGAGFDMAYAGKLFAPFQRLHTPAEFEGTGIGLSIVQRIIHGHQGRIWAEGQPNHGATFYFTLP